MQLKVRLHQSLFIGVCKVSPSRIPNTIETGSGNLYGDRRSYCCNGNYRWDDGSDGCKTRMCNEDGEWNSITNICISVPIIYYLVIFLHLLMIIKRFIQPPTRIRELTPESRRPRPTSITPACQNNRNIS